MINKEKISIREAQNDGQSVYLYYDETIGCFLAFGHSAFYVDHVVSPRISYSEKLMMPVAILTRQEILELRQSMRVVEHTPKDYYHLQAKAYMGDAGYDKWLTTQRRL